VRIDVIRFSGCALAIVASIVFLSAQAQPPQDPTKPEFYTTQVMPILTSNCASCHGGVNHRGGLNIDMRESLLKGGHSGPAIVPGDPGSSLLVKLIRHEGPADDPKNMPPNKPKLSDADIKTIETWIKAGAVMP